MSFSGHARTDIVHVSIIRVHRSGYARQHERVRDSITWYPYISINSKCSNISSSLAIPSFDRVAHFLPDFLMPCEPVFKGPFLPLAELASSSRAFLSVKWYVSFCDVFYTACTLVSLMLLSVLPNSC
jgi:hypothetical protein